METFFYGTDPVGETLYIEGRSFTVIGVLSDSEDSSISSMLSGSNDIMIPYTTALKMNNASTVSMLTVYIDSAESSAIVESELEEMLDALFNYEDDTYTITTMEGIEDTMSSMLSMMSALLGGIGGGRHWNYEYDAHLGDRAHRGNWPQKGHWRRTRTNTASVFD